MKIVVIRKHFTSISTIGELSIDGEPECVTLEDCDRRLEDGNAKIQDSTAIPRGVYKVIIDPSARFKKLMPRLLNVPGFEGIRIHSGNTAADTSGCILLGRSIAGPDAISNSRFAYDRFFNRLEAALCAKEEVTIEIN
jgi:hypothetical protein